VKISDDDIKNASVLKQAWSSGLSSYEDDLLLRKIFSLKRISPGDSAWLARARAPTTSASERSRMSPGEFG